MDTQKPPVTATVFTLNVTAKQPQGVKDGRACIDNIHLRKVRFWAGDVVQSTECSADIHEALGSMLNAV